MDGWRRAAVDAGEGREGRLLIGARRGDKRRESARDKLRRAVGKRRRRSSFSMVTSEVVRAGELGLSWRGEWRPGRGGSVGGNALHPTRVAAWR